MLVVNVYKELFVLISFLPLSPSFSEGKFKSEFHINHIRLSFFNTTMPWRTHDGAITDYTC